VPRLTLPTTSVRASYLEGEREIAIEEGLPTSWIEDAAADFASFVDRRRRVGELWAVPVTELWFVDGSDYLGTVVIRHRLTPALTREGGHIGYHVVPPTDAAATPPRCWPRPSPSARVSDSPTC
jgi:predicted acetyltransferase